MYFLAVVVLSLVFLNVFEYSTAAIGVAKAVDKTARRTGIFKWFPVVHGQKLGLAGRYVGVGIHLFDERR